MNGKTSKNEGGIIITHQLTHKGAHPENKSKLGLKSSTDPRQLLDRIAQTDIDIFEFHLVEDDLFGEKRQELEYWIAYLKNKGVEVYLHHPGSINGELLHINATDSIPASYFELSTRIIVEICENYDIYTVVHWDYSTPENLEANQKDKTNPFSENEYHALLERTLAFDKAIGKGRILWENSTVGIGAYRSDFQWAEMVAHTDLNLTLDISHAFISLRGNNDDLERLLTVLKDNVKYCHVVDSMGQTHDSLPIGQGGIDFARIKPFITPHNYIYEVGLSDIHDCTEMVESHQRFSQL